MHSSLLPGFTILKQLGQGSYGTVYKVRRESDKKAYALKVVDMGSMNQRQKEDSVNEIRIMASVSSPFIIAFHEASVTGRKLNIVSEYAKLGDLSHAISRRRQKKKPFKEETIWRFLIQMLEGLRVLHDRGIVHRDLKSANIMLSAPDLFKIGDLGISTVLSQRKLAKTQIGTPMYLAPEIWKNRPYDSKCDIWSLGVLLFEMATFSYPYTARNARDLSVKVCSSKPPKIPSTYSHDLIAVVNKMLNQNPVLRPNIHEILEMPQVKSRLHLIDAFATANEVAHADLIETIKVPRNLQALNLPRPRYGKDDPIFIPIEDRLHVKGHIVDPQKKLSLVSTKELQLITDNDCWSPVKEPRRREIRPDIPSSDDDEPPELPPRPPSEPPAQAKLRPRARRVQVPGRATPPQEPSVACKRPPRVLRFRYRQPLMIR